MSGCKFACQGVVLGVRVLVCMSGCRIICQGVWFNACWGVGRHVRA